jgi:hypothetical protein
MHKEWLNLQLQALWQWHYTVQNRRNFYLEHKTSQNGAKHCRATDNSLEHSLGSNNNNDNNNKSLFYLYKYLRAQGDRR